MPERITYTCDYCKWHESFSWVCCNGESEKCTECTEPKDTCDKWEKRDEKEMH